MNKSASFARDLAKKKQLPYVLFNEDEVEVVFGGANILPTIGNKEPQGWQLAEVLVVTQAEAHVQAAKRRLRDLVLDDETWGIGIVQALPTAVELGLFRRSK
jgi:hypothetical protein